MDLTDQMQGRAHSRAKRRHPPRPSASRSVGRSAAEIRNCKTYPSSTGQSTSRYTYDCGTSRPGRMHLQTLDPDHALRSYNFPRLHWESRDPGAAADDETTGCYCGSRLAFGTAFVGKAESGGRAPKKWRVWIVACWDRGGAIGSE
jgi:hypothetical protein